GHEHVIEGRPPQTDVDNADVGDIESTQHRHQRLRAPVDGSGELAFAVAVMHLADGNLREHAGGGRYVGRIGKHQFDSFATDLLLQFVCGAAGNTPTLVDDHDLVCQPIGLFQVLRG